MKALDLPHWVCQGISVEQTRRLLDAGADVNKADGFGRTALHWAQSAEQTRLLLDAGANPNVHASDGRTPLHEARSTEQARALIESGAKVSDSLKYETKVVLAQAQITASRHAQAMAQSPAPETTTRLRRRA